MDYKNVIDFIRAHYNQRQFVPQHEPYFGGNEKKYLNECVDSTFVSSVGKFVDQFENMARDLTGVKYAIATVNGTAALHIALKLAGVQNGDLVLTQPFTFIATCNAISYCGAEPVFIDTDRKSLGLSADALEEWLSANAIVDDGHCYLSGVHESREATRMKDNLQKNNELEWGDDNLGSGAMPKLNSEDPQFGLIREMRGRQRISACVPMHTFGHPCEIDRIVEICSRYHIPVVEDSAESIGSYYRGRHTGTFGLLGVLSFNGNKTITTGGGGMILTDDDVLGPLARHITTTAKLPHPWRFDHDMIGYNYRLPNLNAAIGCAQLEMLPEILRNKRATAEQYQAFFADQEFMEFVPEPPDSVSNYWLCAVLLKNAAERDSFLQQCLDARIVARPAWTLMNELPMFRGSLASGLSVSAEISSRLVNLPSGYVSRPH